MSEYVSVYAKRDGLKIWKNDGTFMVPEWVKYKFVDYEVYPQENGDILIEYHFKNSKHIQKFLLKVGDIIVSECNLPVAYSNNPLYIYDEQTFNEKYIKLNDIPLDSRFDSKTNLKDK